MRLANLFGKGFCSQCFRKRRRVPQMHNWFSSATPGECRKKKIVVLLGATGCGKTRLSIDLATRFDGEVINSDKMQLYQGLDITTNKIPLAQRRGVRHHLLGDVDPSRTQVSPSHYRSLASSAISDISSRSKLPILAGGSNSFVYALLARHFQHESNVFTDPEVRYHCCFIWVDCVPEVLDAYLDKRVDDMMQSGMLNELAAFYATQGVDSRPALRNAIGVPEFSDYFRRSLPPDSGNNGGMVDRKIFEQAAIREIKEHTRQLARAQRDKIQRLRQLWWNLRCIDTTHILQALMYSRASTTDAIYQNATLKPATNSVHQFLLHS